MPPFQEMVNHAKRENVTLLHQESANTEPLYKYLWGFVSIS